MKKYYRNIDQIVVNDGKATVVIDAGSLFELMVGALVLVDDDVFIEVRFEEEKFRFVGNDLETVEA